MSTLTRSKKYWNEKIKFFLLVAAFIALSVYTQQSNSATYKMESPDGYTERFSSERKNLDSLTKEHLAELGIKLDGHQWLCKSAKPTPWRQVRQVEARLELTYLVQVLKDMNKPRRLSENQLKSLKKLPNCEPYLADLKVISNLLKGYELIDTAATE